jgi:hypothetical protein
MADYVIILDGVSGYGVEVTWVGAFRSVRGFATEAAAQAWIDAELLRERSSFGPEPDSNPA